MTIAEARLEICRKCGLYIESAYGPRCNKHKYINKDGLVSWLPKEGYIAGCGCLLEKRVEVPENHCIVNKW